MLRNHVATSIDHNTFIFKTERVPCFVFFLLLAGRKQIRIHNITSHCVPLQNWLQICDGHIIFLRTFYIVGDTNRIRTTSIQLYLKGTSI